MPPPTSDRLTRTLRPAPWWALSVLATLGLAACTTPRTPTALPTLDGNPPLVAEEDQMGSGLCRL